MASCLLSVMHWNNIGTGLELRHMGCFIKRGFQVFLLQSLSSSLGTFETISSIVWKVQSMRMIATIS